MGLRQKIAQLAAPRFALRTLFFAFLVVAAYFGGRASLLDALRNSERQLEESRRREARAEEEVARSNDRAAVASVRAARLQAAIDNGTAFPVRRIIEVWEDGTLLIRPTFASHTKPVRLYGVLPEPPYANPWITKSWLGKDARVTERGKDRWGRFLVDVTVDGKNLNAELLRAGFALYDKQNVSDEKLAEAEKEAREARRGLWGK